MNLPEPPPFFGYLAPARDGRPADLAVVPAAAFVEPPAPGGRRADDVHGFPRGGFEGRCRAGSAAKA